jgi:hypothetical protein
MKPKTDSERATAGSMLAEVETRDEGWQWMTRQEGGGPAMLARPRSGPRKTQASRRMDDEGTVREVSPTRSMGSRPRRLTRSALAKVERGAITAPPPRIVGEQHHRSPHTTTHRSELSAMARKDLNNARWSVPRLTITASFQEFTTWMDQLNVWARSVHEGRSLEEIGPHSLRQVMNSAVDADVYSHLRYDPAWNSADLAWSQIYTLLQEGL